MAIEGQCLNLQQLAPSADRRPGPHAGERFTVVPEDGDRGPMLNLQQRLQHTVALAHMQVTGRGLVPGNADGVPMPSLLHWFQQTTFR
jgi:hypothetical protein